METWPGSRAARLLAALRTALIALALAGCCCPALPPAGLLAQAMRAELEPAVPVASQPTPRAVEPRP